ncbi:MAG TPA: hypothetical protein VGB85_23570 [Nannocystis sp.]
MPRREGSMGRDDDIYWRRRAQQERERAMLSDNLTVREVHRELAAAYEARLEFELPRQLAR